jgi:hypothetical protein
MSFSPRSFLIIFSALIESGNIICRMEDGLTWLSLFNLFCHQRKSGEQLHEYLGNYLSHSVCRRNLGIDVEAIQKVIA